MSSGYGNNNGGSSGSSSNNMASGGTAIFGTIENNINSVSGRVNMTMNNRKLDKLFINIGEQQMINLRNHFTKYFDTLKQNAGGVSNEKTKLQFDISLWLPNKESTNESTPPIWSLPSDYYGSNDPRIVQIPTEFMDPLTLKTDVYEYVDSAGEPGYKYNNRTLGYSYYSAKKLILNYFTTLTYGGLNSFKDISNVQNVSLYDSDNYDVELIVNDTFPVLLTQIGKSAFGASKDKFTPANMDTSGNYTYDNSGAYTFGVYRNGGSTYLNFGGGISGNTDGFIFIDINGVQYRHKLTDGKHILLYKVRKNTSGGHDVIILLDGNMIFDIPNGGANLNQINYIGTNDASLNTIGQRPNTKIRFYDLSNNLIDISLNEMIKTPINGLVDISYANISSDNSFNPITDIEILSYPSEIGLSTFPESSSFVKNNKRIPYIGKFDYKVIDKFTLTNISSRIDNTGKEFNFKTRLGNWSTKTDNSGNTLFNRTNQTPCTAVYKYGAFFMDLTTDFSNNVIYPKQLDLSYNNTAKDLTVSVSKRQVLDLMYGFLYKWLGDTLITRVDYNIYAWRPETNKLTYYTDYTLSQNLTDLSNVNITGTNASDLKFLISPNGLSEIFNPNIPNKYDPTENLIKLNKILIPGKWLFAWTYIINNNLYVNESPEYTNYDVSFNKIIINNSNYLYEPKNIILSVDKAQNGQRRIKTTIDNKEKHDFINFVNLINSTFDDLTINNIVIYHYLWTPNKEITYDPSGWKLPDNYVGENDVRIKEAPILYYDTITTKNKIYDGDISDNILGYDISKAFIKTNTITMPITMNKISHSFFSISDISANNILPNVIDFSKNNLPIPYISRWGYKIGLSNNTESHSDISYNQIPTYDDSGNTFTIGNNYYRTNNWNIITDSNNNESFVDSSFNKYYYSNIFVNKKVEVIDSVISEKFCDLCAIKRGTTKTKESLTKIQRYSNMAQNFKFGPRISSAFNCND